MPGRDPKKFLKPQVDIGKNNEKFNLLSREARAKKALEKYERAEKVKVQDEKDMLNVQGAKDGGRIGLKDGSKGKDTSGMVPVEKIKKEFPDASPQKVARLQSMLGDKTAPMKKERLFEGDKGRRKKIMKKAAKAAIKALTPFKSGGRAMLRGGGICKRGMNKKAVGKNS